MTSRTRPLSPHLQLYSIKPLYWVLSFLAVLSFGHRVTGIVLMIGTLLLAFWLGSAAFGPDAYNFASSLLGSWIGLLVLLGWTFCLWFHLLNGVRHLFWDCGLGFSLKIAVPSGYLVLLATCGLTVLTWAPWVYSKLIA